MTHRDWSLARPALHPDRLVGLMAWLDCPVCGARFHREPNEIRKAGVNCCSYRCRNAVRRRRFDDESLAAYAAFVPEPTGGPHDQFITEWRARRIAFEREREAKG